MAFWDADSQLEWKALQVLQTQVPQCGRPGASLSLGNVLSPLLCG